MTLTVSNEELQVDMVIDYLTFWFMFVYIDADRVKWRIKMDRVIDFFKFRYVFVYIDADWVNWRVTNG